MEEPLKSNILNHFWNTWETHGYNFPEYSDSRYSFHFNFISFESHQEEGVNKGKKDEEEEEEEELCSFHIYFMSYTDNDTLLETYTGTTLTDLATKYSWKLIPEDTDILDKTSQLVSLSSSPLFTSFRNLINQRLKRLMRWHVPIAPSMSAEFFFELRKTWNLFFLHVVM